MKHNCGKNEIWRTGYSRKGSKKGSKKISVKGACIKSTSQTGEKTSVIMKKRLSKKNKEYKIAREKFGVPRCDKGEIIKEGYKKKSKRGKSIWVAPTCVKSINTSKPERTIYIEPHRLSKYGYESLEMKSERERHDALNEAVKSGEKPLSVARRLTALSTLTKNTKPRMSRILKSDSAWLRIKTKEN